MTQQVLNGTPTTPAAPETHDSGAVFNRANALIAKMGGAAREEAHNEPDDVDVTDTPTKPDAPQARPQTPAAADPDESRLAKLADVERKARAVDRREREIAEREAKTKSRAAELEELASIWDNPEKILEQIEKKVGPEKLVKWFEDQADPVKRATSQSKKELTPLEERLAALEARNAQLEAKEAQGQAEQAFSSRVSEVADQAPYASRLLKRAPGRLVKRADAVVDYYSGPKEKGGLGLRFGEDYTFDNVIAQIEQDLKGEAELLAADPEDQGEVDATRQPADLKTQAKPAIDPAKTISNRTASNRTTLDASTPKMSLDEKIRAAERKARRMT